MDGREFVVGVQWHELHLDYRYGCRVWTEPLMQYRQIWQPARIQFRVDQPCQLRLAAAIVGERQQLDCQFARALVAYALVQRLEGSCIGRAREQLIAVDQIVERHRLLAQRVDNVPIINDVTALALRYRPSTPQRHHRSCSKETLEPVIVEVHAQAMANEPRWRCVEDAAQDEADARRDGDDLLLVIGRPALG